MRLAVISPFYSPEGISDYSEQLYASIIDNSEAEVSIFANKDVATRTSEDKPYIFRTWVKGEIKFDTTISDIKKKNIQICHIQYHSEAFFPIAGLDNLIANLINNNIKVFVTLHAVKGKGFDFVKESKNLKLASKVLIHNEDDYRYAKSLLKNVSYFPHPRVKFPMRKREEIRKKLGLKNNDPIFATHGILNVNKNVLSILKAVIELKKEYPTMLFLFINAVVNNNAYGLAEYNKAIDFIKENDLQDNVRFFPEFLHIEQIILLLQAADAAVLAYSESGESASGAISKCLAAGIPTIVSDVKAFLEFDQEVYRLKRINSISIAKSLKEVLADEELKNRLTTAAYNFIEANTFEKKAQELIGIYNANA